jgi:hypothetical protein
MNARQLNHSRQANKPIRDNDSTSLTLNTNKTNIKVTTSTKYKDRAWSFLIPRQERYIIQKECRFLYLTIDKYQTKDGKKISVINKLTLKKKMNEYQFFLQPCSTHLKRLAHKLHLTGRVKLQAGY